MGTKRFFHAEDLSAIRKNCNWRQLVNDLGVRADIRRCTDQSFWGFSPFTPNEKSASFHMTEPGIWYDWSADAVSPPHTDVPGGGVIELVQAVHAARGHVMKLNEAAAFLLDGGYAHLDKTPDETPDIKPKQKLAAREVQAPPISPIDKKQVVNPRDLSPLLQPHRQFSARGISPATCQRLRCGYLPAKNGPLSGRLVFQIAEADTNGARIIRSHFGRAIRPSQERNGKWRFYKNFQANHYLLNHDTLLLTATARAQTQACGFILLVEGAFDVAKLAEAQIANAVACFGANLSRPQLDLLAAALAELGVNSVRVFFDRDAAGEKGARAAVNLLQEAGIRADRFNWQRQFTRGTRQAVTIPDTISDPADFSVAQLAWFRSQGIL